MTVDELLHLARDVAARWPTDGRIGELARGVVTLLADDGTACGMPRPTAKTVTTGITHTRGPFPVVTLPDDIHGDWDARDARAFARALLRCCDLAEGASVK